MVQSMHGGGKGENRALSGSARADDRREVLRGSSLAKPRGSSLRQRLDRLTPVLMFLPAAVVVLLLFFYPLLYNAYVSLRYLTTTNLNIGGAFAGLENFTLLFSDRWFYHSVRTTAIYVLSSVAIEVVLGFGLALLLYRHRHRLRTITTVGLLLPLMTTPVAAALIWRFMLNYQVGIVNYLIEQIGLGKMAFTSNSTLALASVIGIDVWQHTAFCFLVLLAGLMGISTDMLEASSIDGASYRQQLRYVILPLMWPVLLVVVLFRAMGAFQAFDHIFILTRGGPARATEMLSIYLYDALFIRGDFGYGAAISFVILVIVSIISVALIALGRKSA